MPSVYETSWADALVPAISDSPYLSMMPHKLKLQIALHALGWTEGDEFEWIAVRALEARAPELVTSAHRKHWNQALLMLRGPDQLGALAALTAQQLADATPLALGWNTEIDI